MIWARLAAMPLTRPEETMHVLLDSVRSYLEAEGGVVVLAVRVGDETTTGRLIHQGWSPAAIVRAKESDPDLEIFRDYLQNHFENDVWIRENMRQAGTHRAFVRADVLGDEPWSSCGGGMILEAHGAHDRMVAYHALSDDLEVSICLDRHRPVAWTPSERDWLLDLVVGLGPFAMRLAMSYGLLPSQQNLSPRERETLLHLLEGEPESLIADEMGLAFSTVHQYVVSIFRKWGVNSRAELMASWMQTQREYVENSVEAMNAAYEAAVRKQ